MKDVILNVQHLDEKKSDKKKSVSVTSSFSSGKVQSPFLGNDKSTRKQKKASNGKSRGAEEPAPGVRNRRLASREKGHMEMNDKEDGGVEEQEDEEGQTLKKDGEMIDKMNG